MADVTTAAPDMSQQTTPAQGGAQVDWSNDNQAAAVLAAALKGGNLTPERLTWLTYKAQEQNRLDAEAAKQIPLFPAMDPDLFIEHVQIMLDAEGPTDLAQSILNMYAAALGQNQAAYQSALLLLAKAARLNFHHIEKPLYDMIDAARSNGTFPAKLDGSKLDAIRSSLIQRGILPAK